MESPYILLSIKLATQQLFNEGKITDVEYNNVMELVSEAESLRKRFDKTTRILDLAIDEMNLAMSKRQAKLKEIKSPAVNAVRG